MSTRAKLGVQAVVVVLMGLGSMLVPKRAEADPSNCSSPMWCWPDCGSTSACSSGNPACHPIACGSGGCDQWNMQTIYCST